MKDGRKSFREISGETGITTPTVKARSQRLVNIGFIESVSPIFEFDIVEDRILEHENNSMKQYNLQQPGNAKARFRKGIKIKLVCEFCEGLEFKS